MTRDVLRATHDIASARVSAELAHVSQQLAPWSGQQTVADLQAELRVAGRPAADAFATQTQGLP